MNFRVHWTLILFGIVYLFTGFLQEIGIFFVLVILHELSHTIVAISHGFKVEETVLYPFGGRAKIDGLIEEDPYRELHIALAGPLTNILLAILFLSLDQYSIFSEEIILFAVRANIILALFNLFPGLPLDGGRVLRASLSKRMSFREATHYACQGGKLVGILLVIFGIVVGIVWQYINITFFLAGLFVFIVALREEKEATYLYYRHLTRKKQLLTQEGVLPCEILIAFEATSLKEVTSLFRPKKYHILHVIDANWEKKAIIEEKDIIDAMFTRGPHIKISQIL
ncbi:M50 family metallopeptidase [Natranaerobius thermophilus]|uniref:M50 family metallopeptidase n=1 Tax=Natranaerobius thermophilus TaxID=375929 RepID=UPI0001665E12|nr:M50 family metallopeptidase [Natranaerobius thermophilus]